MNSPFTMVFMIILVVIIADLIKGYMKRRDKTGLDDKEVRETLARMDLLEDRIQVLERIVTESRYDLKKQIDNL